ncbi:MAG: hypothetical protein V9E93_19735 [Steroidobacteraceae bacterium]
MSAANVFLIQIGMRFVDRGRHRRRVDDLGAEVREFHRLVVGERVDHLRLGHEARVSAQDAVDVGPDHDLGGIEQRAEDRCRVVAAVAAQRRLQALRVGCDEAGHDQRADELGRHQRSQLRPGLIPAHARSHRAPLHQQRLAGVQPLHVTRRAAAQQAFEQARRPDLAIARDQVAHRGRGVADQAHRLQDARDVATVDVESREVFVAQFAGEQFARDTNVALTQLLQPIVEHR